MEQSDVEMLIGELETRMERLRSLYDMYFMGIERIEPLVPKKDVERRMVQLRKEQIRNTGLRFKFQTVIQRFNTYQTYWLRISRQIEQGTYARDVKRATARFGVDPAKERASEQHPPETQAEEEPREAKVFELPEELVPESGDPSLLQPLDAEDDPFAQIATPPPPPAPSAPRMAPRERFASAARIEFDDLADPFVESDPFPRPSVAAPGGQKLRIAPRPGATKMPPAPEEHRDTERRIPIATTTSFSPKPLVDPADQGPGTVPAAAVRGNEQRVVIARRPSMPDEGERAPSASTRSLAPTAPVAPPSASTLQRPATLPSAMPLSVRIPPPFPPSQPSQGTQAPPPVPSAEPAPRRPATLPSAGVVFTRSMPVGPPTAQAPPSTRSPGPVPPASSTTKAAPSMKPPIDPGSAPRVPAAPTARPAVSRPTAAPASQAGAPAWGSLHPASLPRGAPPRSATVAPQAPQAPASRVGDMSGDRFGEIFSKYVETRQKQNEPTHAITRDALAKQLLESTQRLKQKHAGKAIDFEVVVKDGKTILRPVVK